LVAQIEAWLEVKFSGFPLVLSLSRHCDPS